jgi:hypothetical protein
MERLSCDPQQGEPGWLGKTLKQWAEMALTIEEAEKLYSSTRKECNKAEHEAEGARHPFAEARGKMHKTRGLLVAQKRWADTAEEQLVWVEAAGVEAVVKLADTLQVAIRLKVKCEEVERIRSQAEESERVTRREANASVQGRKGVEEACDQVIQGQDQAEMARELVQTRKRKAVWDTKTLKVVIKVLACDGDVHEAQQEAECRAMLWGKNAEIAGLEAELADAQVEIQDRDLKIEALLLEINKVGQKLAKRRGALVCRTRNCSYHRMESQKHRQAMKNL